MSSEIEAIEAMNNKRAHVLMLEDNVGIHAALIAFAKGARLFDLEIASTSAQVLTLASIHRYDAFILDVRLGEGETGVSTAMKLHKRYPYTPIAFYSSYDVGVVYECAKEIGAQVWNKSEIPESELPTMITGLLKGGH